MKKIPSLFIRNFTENSHLATEEVTPGCEWVINGEGLATVKFDGTCCLVMNGNLYARFDLKPGRILPLNAIPCQDAADPVTGHFPHWVATEGNPNYKWHNIAYAAQGPLPDGTYELCGPHFNGNPEKLKQDTFIRHGSLILENVPRDYDGLKSYLERVNIEGIVFHRGNGEMCKIKRSDFGFEWNHSTGKESERNL